MLLPRDDAIDIRVDIRVGNGAETKANDEKKKSGNGGKFSSFFANLRSCFSSPKLATAVTSLLLLGWVQRTTSYANMASFYEEKYGVEPHQRGYISSYQQCLNFLVSSFFIKTLLSAARAKGYMVSDASSCCQKVMSRIDDELQPAVGTLARIESKESPKYVQHVHPRSIAARQLQVCHPEEGPSL